MRTTILIIAAAVTAFGLWSAGCQRENQARIPSNPETRRIARAPRTSARDVQTAPIIAAEVDPNVTGEPDQSTLARLRAVKDREAELAYQFSEPDKFEFPEEYPVAQQQPATTNNNPDPFWSKPISALPSFTPTLTPPDTYPDSEYSTMAPMSLPTVEPAPVLINPLSIPGMFFGPNDMALDTPLRPNALTTSWGTIESDDLPSGVTRDAFENIDLDWLTPTNALDGLSSLDIIDRGSTSDDLFTDWRSAVSKESFIKPIKDTESTAAIPEASSESPLKNVSIESALAPLPDLTAIDDVTVATPQTATLNAVRTPDSTKQETIKDESAFPELMPPAIHDKEYQSFIEEMSGMTRNMEKSTITEVKPITVKAKTDVVDSNPLSIDSLAGSMRQDQINFRNGFSNDVIDERVKTETPLEPIMKEGVKKPESLSSAGDKIDKEQQRKKQLAVEPEAPPLLDIF